MDDELKFQFKPYQRQFKQPLRTSHGVWQVREGIIISLTDRSGVVSQGEIAPLPWFGSETMSEALAFCQQLTGTIKQAEIKLIRDRLPCCQFAFESAWLNLNRQSRNYQTEDLDYCYLLPAGKQALTTWQDLSQRSPNTFNTTFKWKIGVYPLTEELAILEQLTEILPSEAKLRLDANGGLNLSQAQQLLSVTDSLERIEFIEQPLKCDRFADLLHLSQNYTTPLALDESVASFSQLQLAYQQGWRSIYIVKAAIMGFPSRLLDFCQDRSLDVVFSTVFETEVGRNAVLNMTSSLAHPRAVGFGVGHFF